MKSGKVRLISWRWLGASLATAFAGFTIAGHQPVRADSSVTPELPSNQVDKKVGYFDLQMDPDAKQTVKFKIMNSSSKTIKVDTTFGTAFTSSSGTVGYTPNLVKPDSSLKINLKDYVTLPKEVELAPHTEQVVSAQVHMPTESFNGVIAGGFNFAEDKSGADKASSSQKAMTVTNEYRYVVGLVLQQNTQKVAPDLKLHTVKASQVNGRNVISANLQNPEMAYLMQMNTQAQVQSLSDKKVKYTYSNAQMEMAPNSNFDLAIPVSIKGSLNNKSSQPLKPGKYRLTMTVLGNKNDAGKYRAEVNNQGVGYDYKWTFTKDFTIKSATARQLNKSDATVTQDKGINWLMVIGIIIIALLMLIIFILLRRKKKDDDDETQEKQG